MNLIDEQFTTTTPFYGVERMTAWLQRQGQKVNHKRVRRLMRLMGLEAVYPKPRLSLSNQAHKKYPYLLTTMAIDHPDQVWCADITYIRTFHGFVYLVAIMDWYSRFVLAWEISTKYGPSPTCKPYMRGAYMSQHLSFLIYGKAVGGQVKVRTGLGKSDCPGS